VNNMVRFGEGGRVEKRKLKDFLLLSLQVSEVLWNLILGEIACGVNYWLLNVFCEGVFT